MKRTSVVIQLRDLAKGGLELIDSELMKLVDDDTTQEDFLVLEIKKGVAVGRKEKKKKKRKTERYASI